MVLTILFYITGFSTSETFSVDDRLTTYRAIKPLIIINMEATICNLYGFKFSPSSLDIVNNS